MSRRQSLNTDDKALLLGCGLVVVGYLVLWAVLITMIALAVKWVIG